MFRRKNTTSTWERVLDDLRPGDVIQITPKAVYVAWVNFIREARVTIVYDPVPPDVSPTPSARAGAFYETRLDSDANEIRLLKVGPGGPQDPIRCSIASCRLGEHPPFHTLSYCWGDLTDLHDIVVDTTALRSSQEQATFKVSKSVVEALRQLRRQREEMVLWIDQICINQSDKEERSQQVAMMAEIYAAASAVHIWLGERYEPICAALRIIRDVFNYERRVCEGGDACRCKGTRHTLSIEAIDKLTKPKHSFKAINEIFSHHAKSFSQDVSHAAGGIHNKHVIYLMSCLFSSPWFRRVWVVQEALLSQKARVHCGEVAVPWRELILFNRWLTSGRIMVEWGHLAPGVYLPSIFADVKPRAGPEKQLTILDVFLRGLELQATDARDQLFALLPFGRETSDANEVPPDLQVSYDIPLERVLANFTRWCIRESRSLAVLSLTHGQRQRTWRRVCMPPSDDEDILKPSWVVGGDTQVKWAQATLDAQFDFKASGDAQPKGALLGDPGADGLALRLQGFRVATVAEITHLSLQGGHDEPLDAATACLLRVYERIFAPCGPAGFWKTREKASHRVEKAAAAAAEGVPDMFSKRQQFMVDHHNAHSKYTQRPEVSAVPIQALASGGGQRPRCLTRSVPTCMDPGLMITSDGMVGLCPWRAKTGDVIAILDGGNVPYLLREVKGGADANEVSRYEFVGESFVMGIMDGEYHREEREKGRKPDIFELV